MPERSGWTKTFVSVNVDVTTIANHAISQQNLSSSLAYCIVGIRLKSPPVDGKANAELIEILPQRYNVSKSQIMVKTGLTSKQKLIETAEQPRSPTPQKNKLYS